MNLFTFFCFTQTHTSPATLSFLPVDSDESLFLRTFFYPNGSYDIQHSAGGSEEGGEGDEVTTDSTHKKGVEGTKGTLSCTGPLPRVVGWETNERYPQIT